MKPYLSATKRGLAAATATVIAGTLALASTAAPALASPGPTGVQYAYLNMYPAVPPTSTNPLVSVRQTVTCPAGTKLVGSGGGGGPYLGAISPSDDAATVDGQVVFDNGDHVVGELVCSPAAQFANVTTLMVTDNRVRPNTIRQTFAKCPVDRYAIGGGGGFNGATYLGGTSIFSNGPTPDGRSWELVGMPPAGASKLRMFVKCAPKTGQDLLITATSLVAQTSSLQPLSGRAYCPAGYLAVAGGYHVANPDGSSFLGGVQPPIMTWSVPVPPTTVGNDSNWYASGDLPTKTRLIISAQCVK
ncbi:hypothetical protein ACWT_3567 [Actinoplanes sp. SE50]|uniref:hypothetical protein n=1 Tax=unclassified Actinoplanes TaxID=2626549 RepID=UPI00023EC0E0|nr:MULTISPECIES: hypothetical protein [unclassified Actinoplanes]AEV84590.1 hypothetical protein ACPL_3695 [Actinoplanes sp. SE50/110]ATO82982.1 hypothetical protein ACWT_3567 [Actinoplanes sp. SE50]SLM00390.1 hypothetical protein ACSP50_3622 [Actinoplanes sp. SE50/110]